MNNVLCIMLCKNFKNEAQAIFESAKYPDIILEYFSSCCISKPSGLEEMKKLAAIHREECSQFEIISGPCMSAAGSILTESEPCNTHILNNCLYLLLNKSIVDHLIEKGSCVISPGWLKSWKSCIRFRGLNEQNAALHFKKFSNILLLDTGVYPDIHKDLKDFADLAGLPYRILPTGLDHFKMFIEKIIDDWNLKASLQKQAAGPGGKYTDRISEQKPEFQIPESEERYRRLVELSPYAIFVHRDGNLIFMNSAGAKLLGIDTVERYIGTPITAFTHPEYVDITSRNVELVQTDGISIPQHEKKLIATDGRILDVEVTFAPFPYEGKQAVLSMVRDITEKKKAHKLAFEKEQRFHQITQNMIDMVGRTNMQGKYEYLSPSCINILGYPPEEFIGKDGSGYIHPDDLDAVNASFNRAVTTLKADSQEFRIRHAEGHYIWVESTASPSFDENGRIAGIVFGSRDISRRKLMEEMLRQSEEHYREFMEFLPDAVFLHNGNEIFFCNKAAVQMLGFRDHNKIIGRPMFDFIPNDRKRSAVKRFGKLLIDKEAASLAKGKIIISNGRLIDIELNAAHFHYEGRPAIITVIRDITERRRVKELKKNFEANKKLLNKALEYDKLKTEFFANISHEFRTPLNVILGTLQLLDLYKKNNELYDNDGRLDRHFNTMKQNCFRLLRLVNNLIDITKIDSNYFDFHPENQNIVSIVEDITLSVVEYIENKGISIKFDTDVEEKIIACDADKIERIVLNLLSNAVKFTKPGGSIDVGISDIGESVKIYVRDTGIGIPQDKLELIFERFRQIDKFLTREHEGSGIGLSLTRSLVEMHGGTITARSQLGEGSEFEITLPSRILQEGKHSKENTTSILRDTPVERINIEFSDIYS